MNKVASGALPTVVLDENGFMQLYNTKGELIDLCGLSLRVEDSVEDYPTVFTSGLCNIASSKEEMMKFYEEERIKNEARVKEGKSFIKQLLNRDK